MDPEDFNECFHLSRCDCKLNPWSTFFAKCARDTDPNWKGFDASWFSALKPFLSPHINADVMMVVAQYAAEIHRVGQPVVLCSFNPGPIHCVFEEQVHKSTWPARIIKQNDDFHRSLWVTYDDGDVDHAMFSETAYIPKTRQPLPGQWITKGVVVEVINERSNSSDCLSLRTDSIVVFIDCACVPSCTSYAERAAGCLGKCTKVCQQSRRVAPWSARFYAPIAYEEQCQQIQRKVLIAKSSQAVRSWHCN